MRVLRIILGSSLAASLGMVLAIAGPFAGDAESSRSGRTPVGLMSPEQLATFADFPLYGLSGGLDGLSLNVAKRISPSVLAASEAVKGAPIQTIESTLQNRRPEVIADFVSLIYGDCDASPTPCMAPLEIQIWRSCNRALKDYELTPGEPYPHSDLAVRGTKAAGFGDRLELYAGSVTIVIFAEESLARRAAARLVPLNARAATEMSTRSHGHLPVPDPGPDCT